MRRREFIALLGGTAGWPLAALAQQAERVRRIGVLSGIAATDPDVPLRVAALRDGLRDLGWTNERTLRIDYRWSAGDVQRMQNFAKQLVETQPDVLVAQSTPVVEALRRTTAAIPIVFVNVADPVGSGFVQSLAKPGGNITGLTNFEPSMGGKWLEILKEVAPYMTRVGLMFNPATTPGAGTYFLRLIEDAAPKFAIEPVTMMVRDPREIETAFAELGAHPNTGLIAVPDTFMSSNRQHVIGLAAKHRLPAIYPFRYFATDGGLIAYGVETVDIYRRSASYVDRILRGDKPADLPVQAPTKFELVINTKTAAALDLTIPPTLLARADEVIE